MGRRHFYESLDRENDYQKEYEKLEELCGYNGQSSINVYLRNRFLMWKKRRNYCSYEELREHLGFASELRRYTYKYEDVVIDINKYLLFCEMLLNLLKDLVSSDAYWLNDICGHIILTIKATVENAGMEIRKVDDEFMIVVKNAETIQAIDVMPELSDLILEYNHYLLRGDLKRKKELLKGIADALEPKRSELDSINKQMSKDFFYMVNNMDIRHNNCDSEDASKYNPYFANLSPAEKEKWYDLIYDQALALIILLEQKDRNKAIQEMKEAAKG